MEHAVLFPFIDPAVQFIVMAAAALVLMFFLVSVSDAWRARQRRSRRAERAPQLTPARDCDQRVRGS